MKTQRTIPALLLAALIVGSFFLPAANAEDVATIYRTARVQETARTSFAEGIPLIPGYNAPYPAAAAVVSGSVVSYAASVSGSFAATAPRIPGYNAAYPSLTVVVTQN